MSFRTVIFWSHVTAGLVAGSVIAVMSFTGVVLAFENEIVEWAERDVRRLSGPAEGAPRLSLETLTRMLKEQKPQASVSSVVISSDPRDAVAFRIGRDGGHYANPYTGEIRSPGTTRAHDFMRVMTDWHRYLAMSGDHRATGKAITGACNTAFLILGISGLYLWWPRKWRMRALKPSLCFVGAKGKARDWNWHNVIGFWSLPVLIVLTGSGMVISYRWAGNLVYTLAGETPLFQMGRGVAGPMMAVPTPAPGTHPIGQDGLLAAAQKAVPKWNTISLRFGGRVQGGDPGGPDEARRQSVRATRGEVGAGRVRSAGGSGGNGNGGASAISVTVKEKGGWPMFVSKTLVLDPFSGNVLKEEGYENYTPGRKARSWLRFLHTGQAFGRPGQLVAGLASLGGVCLVYTGLALSCRRFFGKRNRVNERTVAAESVPAE